MGRLLLILGIIFLAWIAYRFFQNTWSQRVKEIENQKQKRSMGKDSDRIQTIKACAYCKTHIPENDGIFEKGLFYCSYQHLDKYQERMTKK
jgi:uncharacterized protein